MNACVSSLLINLKVALPEECHWLQYGHTKYLAQDFLKDFGRVCVDAADVYGHRPFTCLEM